MRAALRDDRTASAHFLGAHLALSAGAAPLSVGVEKD
jgi:hypothetical protein